MTVTSTVTSIVSTTSTATTRVYSTSQPQNQPTVNVNNQLSSTRKNRETIEAKRERKAAKTLAIITGAFVACWLPFFLAAFLQAANASWKPPDIVADVFLWLGYFNSTLNPVIYTIFSPEFRLAFKRMLCRSSRTTRWKMFDSRFETS